MMMMNEQIGRHSLELKPLAEKLGCGDRVLSVAEIQQRLAIEEIVNLLHPNPWDVAR